MPRRRARRGLTLIEIMVGVLVLGATLVAASAMFPLSALLRDRSGTSSRAAAVAQRKMEQVRRLTVDQLNYAGLRAAGVVDVTESAGGPFPFTSTDSLAAELASGSGTLTLTDAGTDLVQVEVTVNWRSFQGLPQTMRAVTFVCKKTVWLETTP